MRKIGLLVALAMVAGSASATLVLSDAEWANAYQQTGGAFDTATGTGTIDSVVDGPLLGDVAISSTIDPLTAHPDGYSYGWVYAMTDLAAPVAGDTYSVQIDNVGTSFVQIMLTAIVDGGTYVQNDGVLTVFDAAVGGSNPQIQIASFDLSVHASIESVGMIIFAPQAGVAGGNQPVIAVPEPATLGLVAAFGGAVLFVRKKFMI